MLTLFHYENYLDSSLAARLTLAHLLLERDAKMEASTEKYNTWADHKCWLTIMARLEPQTPDDAKHLKEFFAQHPDLMRITNTKGVNA